MYIFVTKRLPIIRSGFVDDLLSRGYGDHIRKTTGLVPDAYFSATKIKWILDHVKGARARAEEGKILFGTVDTWLLWKLTGGAVHATDVTNASRTRCSERLVAGRVYLVVLARVMNVEYFMASLVMR